MELQLIEVMKRKTNCADSNQLRIRFDSNGIDEGDLHSAKQDDPKV
jgi:hypothetical protein